MGMIPIHGHAIRGKTTPEYRAWSGIKSRCNTPSHKYYPHYGGRGIKVCARWDSFQKFFDDMGPRPSSRHSIDRIDNNGNYSPKNCRWATPKEQALNTRRAKFALYRGKQRPLMEIAAICGLSYKTIYHRIIDMNWSIADAVSKPVRYYPPRNR